MAINACKKCGKEFYTKPSAVAKGNGKFCSAKCHHDSSKKGDLMKCSVCFKEVYKSLKALKGSKSGKYFCSKSCQTTWRNGVFSGPLHHNWNDGKYTYRNILLKTGIKQICILCECGDKRVLVTHHIDENHFNNDPKNLAWLCHNCHHLVHHDKVEKQRFLERIKGNL